MNEEIDDGEFYHHDFTTASEWEIFIARMEEILHEWKIQESRDDVSLTVNEWNIKSEIINFADVQFTLSYYKYTKNEERKLSVDDSTEKEETDVFNSNYDFLPFEKKNSSSDYSLYYWYGLHHFIILSSSHLAVNNESQIKILLSSVNIVLSNSACDIPMFVQIREKWQCCYQGVQEINGIRTNFEMVHLWKGPQHCKYLTGLLDLFKTKISPILPLEPVSVSVSFSFTLSNWMENTWPSDLDAENLSDIVTLQFGVNRDPLNELILNAIWLHLPEHLIVDSENYSDFDPVQAPIWSVKVSMTEYPVCLLSECLSEFMQLYSNSFSLKDLLGDIMPSSTPLLSNPLDILTESPVPTISTVVKRATMERKPQKKSMPVDEDTLMTILYFLFPDAETDHNKIKTQPKYAYENDQETDNTCPGFKTCNPDSLVWRLAIILSQAMVSLGGAKTVAYLWYEFAQEMRYRWDNSILIPGINPGFPDTRTCILHQKLQMLNCCIERKKTREQKEFCAARSDDDDNDRSSEADSEDEFYDCDADKEEDIHPRHSLWNKPVGRLSKHSNLKLIKTGEQLYIPITQEPVPKTEDQLEEDTDVLLKLGEDELGSELRARMMSASLLSDMESFKAANPDAIIDDFIRWYSPTDWIEEKELDKWGQKKGKLSTRMLISDNPWMQMWESAKPVPANRQKRLFDDTREAEKVLHYLESKTLAQICEHLLAVLSHVAIFNLTKEIKEISKMLPNNVLNINDIIKNVRHLTRESRISIHKYEAVFQEICVQELIICQLKSLMFKFNPTRTPEDTINSFILNLVTEKEVYVVGGAGSYIGKRLTHMFSEVQKAVNMTADSVEVQHQANKFGSIFPQPSKREFVMRVRSERPELQNTSISHLLRAVLTKNDFRLCGAFSENIIS